MSRQNRVAWHPARLADRRTVAGDIDKEVWEMLSGEIAKYQIEDRVREAKRDRVARSVRKDRSPQRVPVTRRVGSGFLAAVTWPKRARQAPPVVRPA